MFCGYQYSLFYDFSAPESDDRPENLTWNTDVALTERRTGITLRVGGTDSAGIVRCGGESAHMRPPPSNER